MSASLVGSEMCIRDSQLERNAITDLLESPPVAGLNTHFTSTIACGYGAVSYTHLTLPTICSV
eukprot:12604983-Alexandrium_andersonii.AAC.1